MIDRKALEELVSKHAHEMERSSTVELHLTDGMTFCIERFEDFYDNYFVAVTFPQKILSAEQVDRIPRDAKRRPIYDRVIFPYQAIFYVRLTIDEPEGGKKFIGLTPQSS
jgi:hypothetical protein